jgi:large subunit ribosomal protein L16
MGKGKGDPEFWVDVIRPGKIIYELEGVSEELAKEAMKLAAQKLPIRTRFITRENRELR